MGPHLGQHLEYIHALNLSEGSVFHVIMKAFADIGRPVGIVMSFCWIFFVVGSFGLLLSSHGIYQTNPGSATSATSQKPVQLVSKRAIYNRLRRGSPR
jgi:hypothetical protein